jgi:1,2-phenylacetyl-CoA epoxidase PaaB subunit
MIYEVFARKTRGEPMRHVGTVTAPDDELARVYAFATYDEEKWFDMWVAPREHIVEVFNRHEPAALLVDGASQSRR